MGDEPRPRGRPSVTPGEHSTPVQVKIPDSLYDRACAEASKARVSVPEVIRRALAKDLETQNNNS